MKKILWAFLAFVLIGAAVGFYLWNKPHENIQTAKVEAAIAAADLFSEFEANEEAANAKYLGKTVLVSGVVKESSKEEGYVKVMLETGKDFTVVCALDELSQHPRSDFAAGETVKMKGKLSGFNLDVQIERCVEVK